MAISKWLHDQAAEKLFAAELNIIQSINKEIQSALLSYNDVPSIIDDLCGRHHITTTTFMTELGMMILDMIKKKQHLPEIKKLLYNTIDCRPPTIAADIDKLDTTLNCFGDQHEVIFVAKEGAVRANIIFTPNYFFLFLPDEKGYAEGMAGEAVGDYLSDTIPFLGLLSSIAGKLNTLADLAYGEFTPKAKVQLKSMVDENKCFVMSYRERSGVFKTTSGGYHLLTICCERSTEKIFRTFAFKSDEHPEVWQEHFFTKFIAHSACHGNMVGLSA